jgi:hypothetical protein
MPGYNDINSQANILANIIESRDLKNMTSTGMDELIKALVFKDPSTATETLLNLILNIPSAIFWSKMERFLRGTFFSFEEQVKFAEKFNKDNTKYVDFVKKQICIINIIESDGKIDYLANLTRCFFLYSMDIPLYFRLVKIIQNCTTEELDFLRSINPEQSFKNNAMISMLIMQGLIVQKQDETKHICYGISVFGKLIKACSLNFGDEGYEITTSLEYDSVEGIPQLEPIISDEIDEILDS